MKRKRNICFLFLLVSTLFAIFSILPAEGARGGRVLRVSDGKIIRFDQMVEELGKSRLVFVGESHTNMKHHENQLAVIQALNRAKAPLAIGLEMFRADNQGELNAWTGGKLGADKFREVYNDNWGMAWPLYRDIFEYARDHRIPMVGLNVPPRISRKVSREGFASLTAEERKQLPPDISCDIDDRYRDFIREVYREHAGRNGKSFDNFCEAQMIWDKAMAWRLMDYLAGNPGKKVVVLAGTGHSWKRGIPEQIKRREDVSSTVILQEVPDEESKNPVTTRDADYIILG